MASLSGFMTWVVTREEATCRCHRWSRTLSPPQVWSLKDVLNRLERFDRP
jgi:hypothetical protein